MFPIMAYGISNDLIDFIIFQMERDNVNSIGSGLWIGIGGEEGKDRKKGRQENEI